MNDIINLSKNEPSGIQMLMITGSFSASQIPLILGSAYNKDGNIVVNQNISDAYIRVGGVWNQFRHIEGEKSIERLKQLLNGTITEIIPEDFGNLKAVGPYKFINLPNLTKVALSDKIETYSYNESNFAQCPQIKEFNMGDGLKQSSYDDFCKALVYISEVLGTSWELDKFTFGKNISDVIGDLGYITLLNIKEFQVSPNSNYFYADQGIVYSKDGNTLTLCPNLKQGIIVIPNNITSIGLAAFRMNNGITSVTFGTNIQQIGAEAFNEASALNTINFNNNSIITFDTCSFREAANLKTVNITSLNNWLQSEVADEYGPLSNGADLFVNGEKVVDLIIPNNINTLSRIMAGGTIESVVLHDGITEISSYAFYRCRKIETANLGSLTTSIKAYAFAGCTNLESIEIPESVTTIGDQAFGACASLTNIIIPSKVQSLGNWLFNNCAALQTVTVLPTTPPSLGYSAFPDNIQTIYVPAESVETYKSAARWSSYASKIQPIQS